MFRREFGSSWIAAAAALYFATALNMTFWRFALSKLDFSAAGGTLFALSMPVVLFLVFYCLFSLLLWPYAGKIVLGVLLVSSSAAAYFMFRLNVIIDSEMIRNVFEAKPHEALEMVTLDGMGWVALFGAVPAFLLASVKIRYRPARRELAMRGLHLLASLSSLAVLAFFFYKDYAIAGRNHKNAGRLLNPFNYISSTRNYFRKRAQRDLPFIVIDDNPEHVPYADPHFTVLVLMIGETARAMNFSLNGYGRQTNPKLSRQDIVNFPNVKASGTATAFSLPCMFSHLPREKFDIDSSYRSENLLDIMAKAGYEVLWLDNDGGSKGVSDRVPTVDLMREGNPKYRNGDMFFEHHSLHGPCRVERHRHAETLSAA